MASATIKIFLAHGDPKRLRTAELSNWIGKAVAGPRNEFDSVLARTESSNSGIYFLMGNDPEIGNPALYVGEAESIKDQVTSHLEKDFWNQIVFFISKDENLTKAHTKYCECRLIEIAKNAGRAIIKNSLGSRSALPESDREEMEVFLEKMQQLLPLLGVELLVPAVSIAEKKSPRGSSTEHPGSTTLHVKLKEEGSLIENGDHPKLVRNVELSSQYAAAVIHDGQANRLTACKNQQDKNPLHCLGSLCFRGLGDT